MPEDDERQRRRSRDEGEPRLIELSEMQVAPTSRAPLVVAAAVLLLAALGIGFALGSGILDAPTAADALSSPAPSAARSSWTETVSPSADSSASPSPAANSSAPWSPVRTADPAIRGGLFPPGSVALVTGGGLRLRTEPSLSAEIIASMEVGRPVYIVSSITAGPVLADGYEWYQVEYADGREPWPYQDVMPPDVRRGWAAAGSDTQRFIRFADVDCFGRIASLETLAALTDWERFACFPRQRITIEGTFGLSDAAASTGIEPQWLGDAEVHAAIHASGNSYPFVRVAMPPGFEPPADGSIIKASMHLDDAAAMDCVLRPGADGTERAYDAEAVRTYCREQFVIESFEVLGTDPNWP